MKKKVESGWLACVCVCVCVGIDGHFKKKITNEMIQVDS